jgi:hypothetical protein
MGRPRMRFISQSLKDSLKFPHWIELPVLTADDDFIEHLHEQGFDSIELEELYVEYNDWAKENVEA